MPVEAEKNTNVLYQIITSVIQTDEFKKRVTYGIKAEYTGDATEILKIRNISLHKSDVLHLIMLLSEYGVAREHLFDIVEDYVQEL